MDLFELQASLTLDTDGFSDALSDAQSVVQSFADSLESGASGAISGLESSTSGATGGILDFVEAEKDAASSAGETGSATENLSSIIGKLGNGAGISAAAIVTGFKNMATGAIAAAKAIAEVATKAAAAVNETASYLDGIDKASQRIGISAKAYQEWSFILEHSGASIDTMQTSMKTLVNAADSGNEAFAKLGITVTDSNGALKSQEQLFSETITALQNMGDSAERTALANDLLGRGAMEFGALLNTSAEDTQAMRDQLEALGGVMSDEAVKAGATFEDMLFDVQTGFNSLKTSMIAEFLPSLSTVLEGVSNIFAGDSLGGIEKMKDGVRQAITRLGELAPEAIEIGAMLLVSISAGIWSAMPELIAGLPAVAEGIYQTIMDHTDEIASAGPEIISALASAITGALPSVFAVINTLGAAICQLIISFGGGLLSAGAGLISNLASGISSMIGLAIGAINNVGASIVSGIASFIGQMLANGRQFVTNLASGITGGISAALGAMRSVGTGIVNAIRSFIGQMAGIGSQIVSGLARGISSAGSAIISAITGVVGSGISAAKALLGIASPSKVFYAIGEFTIQGFELGLLSKSKSAIETVGKIAEAVAKTYSGKIASVQAEIDAINAAQDQRDAEKAARERAEKLAELEAKVAAAVGDERTKAEEELRKQKEEWAEADLRAEEEAQKKLLNARIASYEDMQDAYEDALDDLRDAYEDSLNDIETAQSKMSGKMTDYGDLFSWESKRSGDYLKLGNLDTSIQTLEKYGNILNSLRDRGIADSLMDEILGMSVDNAVAYGQKLLDMGEGTFQSYMSKYLEKNALAESIAESWYSGAKSSLASGYATQTEKVNQQYAEKIGETIAVKTEAAVEAGISRGISSLIGSIPPAVINIDGNQLAKSIWNPLVRQTRIKGSVLI